MNICGSGPGRPLTTIKRGETWSAKVTKQEGSFLGATVTSRMTYADGYVEPIITIDAEGVLRLALTSEQTMAIPEGSLRWDIRVEDGSGVFFIPSDGDFFFTVIRSVTGG